MTFVAHERSSPEFSPLSACAIKVFLTEDTSNKSLEDGGITERLIVFYLVPARRSAQDKNLVLTTATI